MAIRSFAAKTFRARAFIPIWGSFSVASVVLTFRLGILSAVTRQIGLTSTVTRQINLTSTIPP